MNRLLFSDEKVKVKRLEIIAPRELVEYGSHVTDYLSRLSRTTGHVFSWRDLYRDFLDDTIDSNLRPGEKEWAIIPCPKYDLTQINFTAAVRNYGCVRVGPTVIMNYALNEDVARLILDKPKSLDGLLAG